MYKLTIMFFSFILVSVFSNLNAGVDFTGKTVTIVVPFKEGVGQVGSQDLCNHS